MAVPERFLPIRIMLVVTPAILRSTDASAAILIARLMRVVHALKDHAKRRKGWVLNMESGSGIVLFSLFTTCQLVSANLRLLEERVTV